MRVEADLGTLKAKFFRGLSDRSRLACLEALRDGSKTVGEVVAITKLSQPSVSSHLTCLWDCGLVHREPRGRFTVYAIVDRRVHRLLETAGEILAENSARVFKCTRYND